MKWFKVYAEIINDPKIRALAYEDRWHFVALMALTCDGTLDEPADLRDELVSVALGLHGIDLEKTKARLMRLRLIGSDWKPVRWDERQASSDPTAAERMRRYRDAKTLKKKEVTDVTRNVTVPVTQMLRVEEEGEEEREGEEESNTGNLTVASGARKRAPAVPVPDILDLYHQMLCPPLSKVEKLTNTRRGLIQQRWREDLPDLHSWADFFRRVQGSDFLMGRSQPRDGRPVFRADLEWICRPANFAKITEGKYDLNAGRRSLVEELTDRSWAGEPKRKKPDWLIGAI